MDRETLKNLQVGDRVHLVSPGGTSDGTVTNKYRGVVTIVWDEKGGTWHLNHRARFDRQRARNIEKVTT